ncbi:dol-P-Glc:Glc(2)Man(9)GlcNAc(2)-PP-Dol alpha-1,2-glucosyltransferase-like isoform X1 [Zingiber officinale]|nr:dol-P-Glc:Glc(2)Man(9)GlcNAc(2)-PP-Dol alpha-1,2-glucosyltransferase-like isoform X1 [Zingiber officinale]XP_042444045.1 dol-P-Glc:Glc(2)Man(9)GlcNAc(2)-PP-Dol alpha-1,2-glucosyltransferase-like isoform X1 [Zingiber officinale]
MGRLTVVTVVSLWVVPMLIMVNWFVRDPYMDEIFHIPQAQHYCRGDFWTWDPMITTPPGLYYLSLAYVASLFPAMWFAETSMTLSSICSTSIIRSTNAVVAIICSVIIYDLLIQLRPNLGEKRATTYAIVLALYPLHWFFTFLYYTDVASLTAVLAMYLASIKRHYWLSATLGAIATLFRQTNIIWMLFVALDGVITCIEDSCENDSLSGSKHKIMLKDNGLQTHYMSSLTSSGLRKRRMHSYNGQESTSEGISSPHNSPGFLDEILDVTFKLWSLKWELSIAFFPFALVLLAFVAFVIWNGSIVLGAKDAHAVSLHFAQMLYFGLCSVAALVPVHLEQAATLFQSFRMHKIIRSSQLMVALLFGFFAVHFFSIAHPYLLADNRHYTFYIWRRVIQVHWTTKYLLIPLYIYSWFSIVSILRKNHRTIWVFSYVVATALVLVPAPLIEFRYYTIPFYLLVLHSPIPKTCNLRLIWSLYVVVNIFTMYLFLLQPFHWAHEPGVQRFIW